KGKVSPPLSERWQKRPVAGTGARYSMYTVLSPLSSIHWRSSGGAMGTAGLSVNVTPPSAEKAGEMSAGARLAVFTGGRVRGGVGGARCGGARPGAPRGWWDRGGLGAGGRGAGPDRWGSAPPDRRGGWSGPSRSPTDRPPPARHEFRRRTRFL